MKCRWLLALSMLAAFVAPVAAHPQKHATLSDEEENKLRDAQDPGRRKNARPGEGRGQIERVPLVPVERHLPGARILVGERAR